MFLIGLSYHSNRDASPSVVSFASQTSTPTTVTKPTFTYAYGPFNLQWEVDINTVDFTFSTSATSTDNIWAAFAFSTDKTMVISKKYNLNYINKKF